MYFKKRKGAAAIEEFGYFGRRIGNMKMSRQKKEWEGSTIKRYMSGGMRI